MKKAFLMDAMLVLVVVLGTTRTSNAQRTKENSADGSKANTVSLIVSLHDFFDGNGILHLDQEGQALWTNAGWGIDFARYCNAQWGWYGSVKYYHAAYYYQPTPLQAGDVFKREVILTEGGIQRCLLSSRRTKVSGLGGLQFRLGEEPIVVAHGNFDVLLDEYPLRDLGISGGLRGQQVLVWNFVLAGEVKFTQYLWRFENGKDHAIRYPNRSTRNMLSLQMGLGYNF
jgi:hypothetical protein